MLAVGTKAIVIAENNPATNSPRMGAVATVTGNLGGYPTVSGDKPLKLEIDGKTWFGEENELLPLVPGTAVMVGDTYPDPEHVGRVGTITGESPTRPSSPYTRVEFFDGQAPESLLLNAEEIEQAPAELVEDPVREEFDILSERVANAIKAAEGHEHLPLILAKLMLGFALDASPEANAALKALVGR